MARFFLSAVSLSGELKGFYTGRADAAWISPAQAEAFSLGEGDAARKAALFNRMSTVHGLRFDVTAARRGADDA